MSKLKCQTKISAINGQSIPRVYISIQEKNFEEVYCEIKEDIQRHIECSIWTLDYECEGSNDLDSMEEDLKKMNLFVIPVISDLMFYENKIKKEVEFARKHKIPILPILLDGSLGGYFSTMFNNLQYIEKYTLNDCGLSYEDKLKKTLEELLLGKELIQRIQRTFDLHVFLSYRKIDKQYALELMQMIHENKKYEAVAIWYDDFLEAGKDFNTSIKKAIEQCDAFLMSVTPHLLENVEREDGEICDNYVARKEYPCACENNKSIIPYEMQGGYDINELRNIYPDIPDCNKDINDVYMKLAEVMNKVAREKNEEKEHTYLLGLAYLYGIEVEVNIDKAIELLKDAAEKEIIDAKIKLANIYRNNENGALDSEETIEWQRKIVSIKKELYESDKSDKNAIAYLDSQYQLGSMLYIESKYLDAERVFKEIVSICNKERSCPDIEYIIGRCYLAMGGICEKIGDVEKAYEKYLSIINQEENDFNKHIVARAAQRLSILCYKYEEKVNDNGDNYKELTEELYEELISDYGRLEYKKLFVSFYVELGNVFFEKSSKVKEESKDAKKEKLYDTKAELNYMKAIDKYSELSNAEISRNEIQRYVFALEKLAHIAIKCGRYQAFDYIKESIAVHKSMWENKTLTNLLALSEIYIKYGNYKYIYAKFMIKKETEIKYEEIIEQYHIAEALLKDNAQQFDKCSIEKALFKCYGFLSRAYELKGNKDVAEQYRKKASNLQHVDDYTRQQLQERINKIYGEKKGII